jgi:hypothetical protein
MPAFAGSAGEVLVGAVGPTVLTRIEDDGNPKAPFYFKPTPQGTLRRREAVQYAPQVSQRMIIPASIRHLRSEHQAVFPSDAVVRWNRAGQISMNVMHGES